MVIGIINLIFLIKRLYILVGVGCCSEFVRRISTRLAAGGKTVFWSNRPLTASYRYFSAALAKAGRMNDKIIVSIVTINDLVVG